MVSRVFSINTKCQIRVCWMKFNNAYPSGVCKRQNGLAHSARWRSFTPTSSRLSNQQGFSAAGWGHPALQIICMFAPQYKISCRERSLTVPGLRCICHNEIYNKAHLRDDASIAPYKFHFITRLFVSPKKLKNAAMYFPSTSLHSYFLWFYLYISRPQPISRLKFLTPNF